MGRFLMKMHTLEFNTIKNSAAYSKSLLEYVALINSNEL